MISTSSISLLIAYSYKGEERGLGVRSAIEIFLKIINNSTLKGHAFISQNLIVEIKLLEV